MCEDCLTYDQAFDRVKDVVMEALDKACAEHEDDSDEQYAIHQTMRDVMAAKTDAEIVEALHLTIFCGPNRFGQGA